MQNNPHIGPLRVPGGTFTLSATNAPIPEALASLGLESTIRESLNSRLWSHSVERVNRYLVREHKRLQKMALLDPVAFWKRATFLVAHSDAFLLASLQHVRPKWYEGDSFTRVIDWLWSAQRARLSWRNSRGVKRFRPIIASMELDKPDGTKREISSPKVQARLLIYLWNYFLAIFCKMPENFHGHRKGKGVPTAWADILRLMDEKAYIWEYDLRKFHDSISQGLILEALLKRGVPKHTALYIIDLCRAQTVLDNEETRRRREIDNLLLDEDERPPWDSGPKSGFSKYVEARGTPQGTSTSSLLGMIALDHLGVARNPDYHVVCYADDGLVFSDAGDPHEWFKKTINGPKSGVFLNEGKSGWVKWNGRWMKDLKFLGLRLNPQERRVYASSRSGRNEGLYFEVGADWLNWIKKVNLHDLVITKQSPGRVTTADEENRLSRDRLRNLPVAIARLFWPGEIYEAFVGGSPPWPEFDKGSLKVMLRDQFAPGMTRDNEGSLYWDMLLNSFTLLTSTHGEQVREPHTKYYPRNEELWAGADWAKERGIFYLFLVERDGSTQLTIGGNREKQEYIRKWRRESALSWPIMDYYKRNWVNYKATPFRFRGGNRDKWATAVGAAKPSGPAPS